MSQDISFNRLTALQAGFTLEHSWDPGFPPTLNDDGSVFVDGIPGKECECLIVPDILPFPDQQHEPIILYRVENNSAEDERVIVQYLRNGQKGQHLSDLLTKANVAHDIY